MGKTHPVSGNHFSFESIELKVCNFTNSCVGLFIPLIVSEIAASQLIYKANHNSLSHKGGGGEIKVSWCNF